MKEPLRTWRFTKLKRVFQFLRTRIWISELFAWREIKMSARESCRSKDNWRALKLDEVLISTCRSLRVITFHLHCLTRWQMFVTSRPPCWRPFEGHWPTWRPHTESPFHLGEEPFFRISREWKPHRPKSWRGCLYINPCFTDPMFLTDYFLWQYESENQQLQN